ncbi:uncharacterized protein LOC116260331 [Nymphaea colorata]|nr:uncharacterized protein LOC116260331 [Nymphaea colorata]
MLAPAVMGNKALFDHRKNPVHQLKTVRAGELLPVRLTTHQTPSNFTRKTHTIGCNFTREKYTETKLRVVRTQFFPSFPVDAHLPLSCCVSSSLSVSPPLSLSCSSPLLLHMCLPSRCISPLSLRFLISCCVSCSLVSLLSRYTGLSSQTQRRPIAAPGLQYQQEIWSYPSWLLVYSVAGIFGLLVEDNLTLSHFSKKGRYVQADL